MHGGARGGEERKRRRHMWPVPTAAPGSPSTPPAPATPLAAADTAVSLLSAPDCFLKDGRKIRVGDCALFQAGDAPPFIGIIRWFATSKEDYLKLCVNWLYRPADVKLAKGILLDAAPNEVFYSFHKDVISAASLLHPCKVAFLRKGIDLPLGKSSFVCRRVYDIENKCLWWLTDQDYINERQEEVDHLLDKTRLEMHAAVQSGGRSPKQLNGSNSTQQLKSASDSVQISGTSFPSQIKGKKRERGDQVTEPIKRERSTKTEDADSGNLRLDGMIKAEIAKMTDKGGLTNSEGVDKLVHIMQLDRAERKLDLAGRVLLADVIAATDRNECLSRFVQLRGVPVLDEWLQEAHKGKNGDGSSPKESDKPVEELLFALLRALDKLPVSLNALQTCNIGKSVNHLRTHKNVEIQKKARSLVDTWKKRVDAEIKNNDAKSIGSSQAVPWPGKPGFSEVSHALNRRPGSADLTIKGSTAHPSTFRALPGKPGHVDAIVKSTPGTMGSLKLPSPIPAAAAISSKDPLPKAAGSLTNLELPQTTAREEKSSSSSQSLNNSQSCSSDHAKTVGSSWKEDARSSTAGSMNASKTSSGSSRHRRSNNGFPMTSISGVQKETSLGKSVSLIRTATSDKIPQGALTCERPLDVPVSDHGNSHRLIVRLPNPGRSPVQIAGGVSFEDPSVTGSRASSPSAVDKHENSDRRIRVKGDRSHIAPDVNAESWQINDSKEALAGRDRRDPSPVATRDDERRSAAQTEKSTDVSRATCPSSGNEKGDFVIEPKTRNSFSSMNALVESCVKYSEASAAISSGDDIGINLLASVAAGEMSKSNLASTTESPAMEEPCAGSNDAKSGFSCDGGVAQNHCQSGENADVNSEKQRKCAGPVSAKDESLEKGTAFSGDKKIVPLLHESKSAVEHNGENPVSNMNMDKPGDSFLKPDAKLEDERAAKSSVCISAELKEESECDGVIQHQDKLKSSVQVTDSPTNGKLLVKASPSNEKKSADCSDGKIPEGEEIAEGNTQTSDFMCNSLADRCRDDSIASGGKSEKPVVAEPPSCLPSDNEVPIGAALMEQQPTPVAEKEHSVNVDIRDVDAGASSFSDKITCPERSDLMADLKARNLDGSQVIHPVLIDSERNDQSNSAPPKSDEPTGHVVTPHTSTDVPEEVVGRKEVPENHLSGSANENSSPMHPGQEAERCTKSAGSLLSGDKAETRDELASSAEVSSSVVAALPDTTTKLDFDLNEGFTGDDGHQSEHAPSAVLVSSPAVHLPRLSSFSSSPNSNGCPATITVAAPAKGPFVHPENLSKYKAEPGWKGSAATSAFRPAEPRKVLEMPLSTAEIPSSHPAGKRGRPLLDIDLNVADERVLEDMASPSSAQTTGSESGVISNRHAAVRPSGGLDLDLNIVGEGADNGQLLASTSCRLDQSVLSVRPASGRLPNGDANMFRDFDLNSGPGLDEVGVESLPRSQYTKGNLTVPFLPPVGGLRMNNPEFGSVSSWFPPGGSYPAVAIPSFLSDRGDHPYPIVAPAGAQRILGSVSGAGTFGGDMYRGPVLSSSPAMAFTPATAFPYAGFPFGSNFPIGSTSFSGVSTTYVDTSSGGGSFFPAIPSQFIGPAGGISAHYPRPYMSSHPEGSASGGSDSSRKWTRQGLDLNAGPGGADTEVKDDRTSSSAPRHLSVAGSQAFLEEQARLYQAAMAGVKRKEPDGGWDAERFVGYKQHSWQ